jgi:regulatory protein
MLARREHSASELQQKLKQKGFSSDEISAALEQLQNADWQSDERFTEAYIRSRRSRGYGPVRIALELKERGIDEALTSAHVDATDVQWLECLRDEYERKYRGSEVADFEERAKRMRFLQYRGFTLEAIYQVMDELD